MGGIMDTKLLIGLAVVLGLLLVAFAGAEIEEPKPEVRGELVGSSSFILELEGTPLLTEEYTIFYRPDEGYTLLSQGGLHVGDQSIRLVQTTNYDQTLRAVAYELIAESVAIRDRVTATAETNGLELKVETAGAEHSTTVPVVSDYAILDNNLIGQFAMLLLAIRADAIGSEFTAVVPQKLLSLPGRIAGPSPVEFASGDAIYEGLGYEIGLGDTRIDLIEYEGRLVGLANRTQGTVAYDAGRFPEGIAPSGEEEALPAGVLEQEVSIQSGELALAGTLSLPDAEGPFPAVLFLHGSGPIDRDGNAPGLPMDAYRQLAHALAEAGVASLRFDKRGVGESQGDSATASMTDLVGDARAALAALRSRPEIDPARVILVGHSEGAYIAPILAREDDDLAGIALLAGAARPLDEITRWQVETALRQAGAGDEQVEAALEQEDEYIAFVEGSVGEWSDYTVEDLQDELAWLTDAAAEQLLATPLGLTWLREHYLAETEEALKQVAVPAFALNGEKDLQVPASEAEAIHGILEEAGNADVTVHVLPDLNHLLRHHPEAPNLLFRHIEEPVDPRVIDLLSEWIDERFGT
jgi:pimeloyl-ACP methyl ester carboxylesterase